MVDRRMSRAMTRRTLDAVGEIGVIETGLPSKPNRVHDTGTASKNGSDSCKGSRSRGSGAMASAHWAQLRTSSACLPKLLGGKGAPDVPLLKEGRAKVLQCETAGGGGRTILHPMRMDIPAGSITAILGTSESGKSTLLKFLAGCMEKGTVYEGAVNLPGSKSYLPEQVFLHRFYTARSYIRHYDRLISARHSRGFSFSSISPGRRNSDDTGQSDSPDEEDGNGDAAVQNSLRSYVSTFMSSSDTENLLDSLRIDTDRRDVIVGDPFTRGLNLSEQRRLELGLLALGSPDTLFCDNPLSELDSETSLSIMEFLKGYISNSSRRVIVTLNRPSNFIWNLIDNVILLSKGRIVYEGPRFDMEAFFAENNKPTPKRFSPLEHYLAVVNNFRRPSAAFNWESAFKKFQEEIDEEDGDSLADDEDYLETCFPTAIPDVIIPSVMHGRGGVGAARCLTFFQWGGTFTVLLIRYLVSIVRNPGVLLLRLVMYTCLSLLMGCLFFDMEHDESYQSVNSRAALLFYSSSFYIFMVVAVLPFLAHDQDIRNKEVLNGLYHPLTHHLAVSIASIPVVLILSLVITGILVGMVKLQNAVTFFLLLSLALWCAESYSFLTALLVKNYIIGIICLAGIFGVSMPLEGFMLVPSKFPSWLSWTYFAPFHTYVWRSLMYNEFIGTPSGEKVLESYEIMDTNVPRDMLVLLSYSLVIHVACFAKISLGNTATLTQMITKKAS